jgi:hypothetical protein
LADAFLGDRRRAGAGNPSAGADCGELVELLLSAMTATTGGVDSWKGCALKISDCGTGAGSERCTGGLAQAFFATAVRVTSGGGPGADDPLMGGRARSWTRFGGAILFPCLEDSDCEASTGSGATAFDGMRCVPCGSFGEIDEMDLTELTTFLRWNKPDSAC